MPACRHQGQESTTVYREIVPTGPTSANHQRASKVQQPYQVSPKHQSSYEHLWASSTTVSNDESLDESEDSTYHSCDEGESTDENEEDPLTITVVAKASIKKLQLRVASQTITSTTTIFIRRYGLDIWHICSPE